MQLNTTHRCPSPCHALGNYFFGAGFVAAGAAEGSALSFLEEDDSLKSPCISVRVTCEAQQPTTEEGGNGRVQGVVGE